MHKIATDERRRRIGARHHLAGAAVDVTRVAADLVGIHSSDPVTVHLSCQARCEGFETNKLEDALYDKRTLVRRLGMRRTLFVVPRGLAPHLQSGCSDRYINPERRRLARLLTDQHGHDEAWLADVERDTLDVLDRLEAASARELVAQVPELATKLSYGRGGKTAGQFGLSTRVLFFLATDGRIVRGRPLGTWVSSQYRWALTESWLGSKVEALDPAVARSELVDRWLSSYGPGTLTDIKWWSGWGVGETRAALDKAGAVEVALEDGTGYVAAGDTGATEESAPYAALLPSLDSTPMGWKERVWYLGGHVGDLYDRNGNIGPTVWLDGRIVGGWTQAPTGEIRLGLLEPISVAERELVDTKASTLAAWLGDRRFTPRFRTPLEKRLTA